MGDRSNGGCVGRGWTVGVMYVCLLLAGCSDGRSALPVPPSAGPAERPALATTSAPPSPASQAAQDALTAYRGMWADWVEIARTSDYQNPRLAQHASGRALSVIYQAVYLNKSKGLVSRGEPVLSPKLATPTSGADLDRITMVDCVDTAHWLNYRADGQLENDVPGGRRSIQALVLSQNGIWKVDDLVVQAKGTC
ncbi:hypothetical protein [Frankia sp. CiP3]|uniref:hypothetical protein n=1 Tax=Frankia sp. CiP3 TaxID=2880971 RepID=UPI001EF59123|nr:hypothetical protein [Frankia sp. CiP3]